MRWGPGRSGIIDHNVLAFHREAQGDDSGIVGICKSKTCQLSLFRRNVYGSYDAAYVMDANHCGKYISSTARAKSALKLSKGMN